MTKERNASIDILRIICMLFVTIIHSASYGLGGGQLRENNYVLSQYTPCIIVIYAFTSVAVIVYFLMSGYFHAKFRLSKLVELIIEGVLYVLITYAISCILGYNNFDFITLCKRVITGFSGWWFYVAYIVIYCFSGYIKKLLEVLSDKELKILLLIYGVLNTILGFIIGSGTYGTAYSVVAMLFIYILGYSIKRFGWSFRVKGKSINLFVYLGISLCLGLVGGVLIYLDHQSWGRDVMVHYQNPLLIVSACALFMFFVNDIKVKSSRLVSGIAVHVFAVYLLTDTGEARTYVWLPLTNTMNTGMAWWLVLLCLIGYAIGLMVACILIDILRKIFYNWGEKFIQYIIKKYKDKHAKNTDDVSSSST